jgi:hypothetical protein
MPVELALAGDRALAADIQGGEGVELAGIRFAGDHAVLLLRRRIGGGRLHSPEFERRALVFVEAGEDRRGRDGFGREAEGSTGAHRAGRFRDRRAVLGDEPAGDTVVGARPCDVILDDGDAGGLAGLDGCVQLLDRRFFETKRLARSFSICHRIARPKWYFRDEIASSPRSSQ